MAVADIQILKGAKIVVAISNCPDGNCTCLLARAVDKRARRHRNVFRVSSVNPTSMATHRIEDSEAADNHLLRALIRIPSPKRTTTTTTIDHSTKALQHDTLRDVGGPIGSTAINPCKHKAGLETQHK